MPARLWRIYDRRGPNLFCRQQLNRTAAHASHAREQKKRIEHCNTCLEKRCIPAAIFYLICDANHVTREPLYHWMQL